MIIQLTKVVIFIIIATDSYAIFILINDYERVLFCIVHELHYLCNLKTKP